MWKSTCFSHYVSSHNMGNSISIHIRSYKFCYILHKNRKLFIALKDKMFISYRYIKSHHLHKLGEIPNIDYLGHPINAYHLIRHVASGWQHILNDSPRINKWLGNNAGRIVWNNLFDDICKINTPVTIRRNVFRSTISI